MYKVYLDNNLIYRPGDIQLKIYNTKLELADSKSGSFSFCIDEENPYYDKIKRMTSEIRVEEDGDAVFYGRVIGEEKDFYNIKNISCEGELAYLLDTYQPPKVFHHYSIRAFLQEIITNHNNQIKDKESSKMFYVGAVTVEDSNDEIYRYTNWEDTLTVINEKLINKLGGHIRIRHVQGKRYIDYLASYDTTNDQIIEFGQNLLDFSQNISVTDIATRVIPLGARLEESAIEGLDAYTNIEAVNGGIPYVENTGLIKQYGIVTKVVNFDDVTVSENLVTKGREYLNNAQYENLTLEVSAIDLSVIDVDISRIKLGDDIRVVSKPHGLDRFFMVSQLSIDLQKPESNTVKLGSDVKVSLTERSTQANENIKKKVNSLPTQSDIIKMAIENASELIKSATTGYVVTRPNEILIMNTNDIQTATKVWRWNLNGLGYSSTGYNGSYGTAITMDGHINGRYIAANSIYAQSLIASELQTAWNGISNYVKLKDGELQIYNTQDTLVSKFNYTGNHFYRDNYYVGAIGTAQWADNESHKGLVFDLEYQGKYMAWAYKEKQNDTSYTAILCYSHANSIYTKAGLHVGCDVYGEWYKLNDFEIGNISADGYEAYSGAIPIVSSVSLSDGKLSKDTTKIRVKNGIVVGYW